MTDQQERVARAMGFAGRARNDVSEDALEWWLYTGEAEQQRLIKMARAAIAAMPAPTGQDWQPIETAPSGEIVLFTDGTKRWMRDLGDRSNDDIYGWLGIVWEATHWMPLPAPPLAEQEGE